MRNDNALDFPILHSRAERLTGLGLVGPTDDLTCHGIGGDGVATRQHVLRAEQTQATRERGKLLSADGELRGGLESLQTQRSLTKAVLPLAQPRLRLPNQGHARVVQPLRPFLQAPTRVRKSEATNSI